MSVLTSTDRGMRSATDAARTTGLAAAAAAVGNLVVLAVATVLGADFDVVRPDGLAFTVGVVAVLAMTVIPLAVGGVALAIAGRWGRRGWDALAWAGLAVGVLSIVMPLGAEASIGTKVGLAAMHALTGLVWFLLLRRGR